MHAGLGLLCQLHRTRHPRDLHPTPYASPVHLQVTTYFANFTARDIRETDMRAAGGITYRHFDGPVLFPFGHRPSTNPP